MRVTRAFRTQQAITSIQQLRWRALEPLGRSPHAMRRPGKIGSVVTRNPLQRLRSLCLALPETTEKEAWGHPTFRVRDKIFATFSMAEEGEDGAGGDVSMCCKAPPGTQEILVGSDPARFFVPAYVGHRGWVGVRLDVATDWGLVADLVEESYRLTAPKRLSAPSRQR
jgi:hypothetical protein